MYNKNVPAYSTTKLFLYNPVIHKPLLQLPEIKTGHYYDQKAKYT